jgi:serine/threonine protein kinase
MIECEGNTNASDGIGFNIDELDDACSRSISWISKGTKRGRALWFEDMSELKWTQIRTLGCGSFGTVESYSVSTGTSKRAVKFMKLGPDGGVTADILAEAKLAMLRHPNVTGVCRMGYAKYPGAKNTIRCTMRAGEPCVAMVMDMAAMSMHDFGAGYHDKIAPVDMMIIAYQYIRALAYIHQNAIANLDIKPGNALVGNKTISAEGREYQIPWVILSDFGLSRFAYMNPRDFMGGSHGYVAPEIVMREQAGPAADVWSCAAALYFIATGQHLFENSDQITTSAMANKQAPDNYIERLRDTRAFANSLGAHQNMAPLLLSMLDFSPETRPRAMDLLDHPYFTKPFPLAQLFFPTDFLAGGIWTVKKYVDEFLPAMRGPPPASNLNAKTNGRETTDPKDMVSAMLAVERKFEYPFRTNAETWRVSRARRNRLAHSLIGWWVWDRGSHTFQTACKAIDFLDILEMSAQSGKPVFSDNELDMLPGVLYLLSKKYCETDETVAVSDYRSLIPDVERHVSLEKRVLQNIDFEVWRPTCYHFAVWFERSVGMSDDVKVGIHTLLLMCLLDVDTLVGRLPSDIASAAIHILTKKRYKNVIPGSSGSMRQKATELWRAEKQSGVLEKILSSITQEHLL